MRIREAGIAVIGVVIITFALSYYVYRFIFKKDLKNWKINITMLLLVFLGCYLSIPKAVSFVKITRGQVTNYNLVTVNGKKMKSYANARERLMIPTAYDTIENTHPSVISFPEKWNGYKYWMGITPYPKADASFENPHVFKSNDLIDWVPDKENPLDEPKNPKLNANGAPIQYNSDTHIIYNKENNRIELFWRYVDDVNDKVIIYRIDTTNGKDWSEKQAVFESKRSKEDMISPAFLKDKEGYKVWYINDGYRIWYRSSKDGLQWSKPTEVKVSYSEKDMKNWHLDVQKTDLGYEMIMSGFKSKGTNSPSERHTMNLYYSKSKDNKEWDTFYPIIFPSKDRHQWDGKGLYRSALLKENGMYYVFYSGIGYDDTRGVGLSYGKDIKRLKGINYSDTSDLHQKK